MKGFLPFAAAVSEHFGTRISTAVCCLSVMALLLAGAAYGQSPMQPYQEYDKRIRATQMVAPLSSDMFGERINLFDRSTSFEHVDISIEGNSGLPVELRRSLEVRPQPQGSEKPEQYGGIGNWDVAVPYITGTFDANFGWNRGLGGEMPRCSSHFYPKTEPPNRIEDIWSGYVVNVPGQGQRELMGYPDAVHRPQDGATRLWITRQFDTFSCVPMASGYPGEGFLMLTAEGVKYRFDVGTVRMAGLMASDVYAAIMGQPRIQVLLLASRVEDRFGNWVEYSYNGAGHPTVIRSNDGRRLDLVYSGGRLSKVTAHGREWTYGYQANQLQWVQQPDGQRWGFAYSTDMTLNYPGWDGSVGANCGGVAPLVEADYTLAITHPSGALGTFGFKHTRHYRSGVPSVNCVREANPQDPASVIMHLAIPNYFDRFSLTSKTVSGAGIGSPLSWTYAGGSGHQPLWSGVLPPCMTCQQDSQTTITQPDGSRIVERYGIVFGLNEGKLLGSRVLSPAGQVLREEELVYMTDAEAQGQPFPSRYGAMLGGNDESRTLIRPLRQRNVVQQGHTFSWAANSFDVFARPVSVTKSSNVTSGAIRAEVSKYQDDLLRWVLGQQARLTVNGTVVSETSYDSLARPTVFASFGKVVQTLGYNADGTVASVKDGSNHVTTLSDWKRGIPQLIKFPATPEAAAGATRSAIVNDSGWIIRATDENGYATHYTHDAMGRLASIAWPSGDTTLWNTTTFTFARSSTAAYGISAGHWQRTEATGNGRKVTYLDALFRPILTREYDTADANGTQRFVRRAFDQGNREIFVSYPASSSAPNTGVWSEYDALGRPTSVSQDSELGVLTTTTQYLAGFKTRTTRPKGAQTTTSYLAWDQPTTDYPIQVAHPAGAFTDIARDAFGKPTAITRRDGGGSTSVTRSYIYDAHHQLCKTVEPETGATIQAYDGAGNLVWSRSGASYTATSSCNTADVPVAQRTLRSYDARNRVQALTFPDHRGDTSYGYAPDGKLVFMTVDNGGADVVSAAYTYNRRGMLVGEALGVGAHQWGIGYGYDANGHLASVTQPEGVAVDYAPNALGQPTAAGAYATGVRWFPNGGIRQFTYGNGIVRTLTQNARGLTSRTRDASGGATVQDDGLDYDQHGNVAAISDGMPGARGHRTMTYDALDRLTQTVSPMFGTAAYTYDVVDNLRRVRVTGGAKPRDHTYLYGTSQRLDLITNTSGGATVASLAYDTQGNLASRNGQTYHFDLGNRLRSVTSLEHYVYDGHGRRVKATRDNGAAIYSMYGQDGVLRYQRDERSGRTTTYIHLGGSLLAEVETAIALSTPNLTVPGYSATGSYTVSWSSAPLAIKYQLQEQFNSGPWGTLRDAPGGSIAVIGKAAGSWGYRVRACSAATCGGWSAAAVVTVQLPPTATPTLNAPATGLNGSYTVAWTGVAAATKYQLRERLGNGSWTTIHDADGGSKAFTGKATGSWRYQVRACNQAGCGGWSAAVAVSVIYPPASAPALTVPESNTTGSYTVTWTAIGGSTRYELQERFATQSWTTIHNASGTSKAVSGKSTGSWSYQVRACNAAGCGGWSAAKSTAVIRPPTSAPALTVPAANASGSYAVTWTAVAQATRYQLQERLGSGGWSTVHDAAGTSKSISGKASGTWSYQVRGCNVAGCGGWSAARSVTVTRPPPVPTFTSSVMNRHYQGELVRLQCSVQWTPLASAEHYELQVQGGGLQYSGPSTSVQGAFNTASYCAPAHVLRACNAGGCSAWSAPYAQTLVEYGSPGGPDVPVSIEHSAGAGR
ncbi:RHS repeat protein [Luteimonas sp. TWI662]|uniref:RHS repeat protein n=1 Tax=Luteimonas sp. TWI662 TaxID=3136789 RepID=UPI003209DED7